MEYIAIVERTRTGYCAYFPDLPGCVTTGRTRAQLRRMMKEAIEFHIEGLQLAGEEVPPATSLALMVEVEASQPEFAVAVAA